MAGPGAPGSDPIDRLFRRAARLYDLQLPLERRALRAGARLAGRIDGRRVLDVAGGTGALAAELVREGGTPAELVVLDRSPEMLARARRRLRRLPVAVRLVRGDARALPFADGRFDLVTLAFLVHLLPRGDAVAALAEARRVLAPPGRVVVVSHSSPRGRAGRAYRAALRLVGRLVPGLGAGGGPIEDTAPLLVEAGLRPLREIRAPGVYWSQSLLAVARKGD